MTKYGQNYSFGATTFKCARKELLSVKKTLWGSVAHFLKFVVKRSKAKLKNDQNGQNYSFGSITPFKVPVGNFCQWQRHTQTVLRISEKLIVKSEGHQMTKYGQKCLHSILL